MIQRPQLARGPRGRQMTITAMWTRYARTPSLCDVASGEHFPARSYMIKELRLRASTACLGVKKSEGSASGLAGTGGLREKLSVDGWPFRRLARLEELPIKACHVRATSCCDHHLEGQGFVEQNPIAG